MTHDDVIKMKHFPRYWPFVRWIHQSLVNSPHKGQWRVALMVSLICDWTNYWANNREADDLRRHCAHYDIPVMQQRKTECILCEIYISPLNFVIMRSITGRYFVSKFGKVPYVSCFKLTEAMSDTYVQHLVIYSCLSLKQKCRFDEIIITDCTKRHHFGNNFRCSQRWKFNSMWWLSSFVLCCRWPYLWTISQSRGRGPKG